jgi:hypothetical protein
MAGIVEFYSRNLASEAIRGMTQKAKVGGTPGWAPMGYLNTRRRNDEGREIRVVVVDPDRARSSNGRSRPTPPASGRSAP